MQRQVARSAATSKCDRCDAAAYPNWNRPAPNSSDRVSFHRGGISPPAQPLLLLSATGQAFLPPEYAGPRAAFRRASRPPHILPAGCPGNSALATTPPERAISGTARDRKSTRLNSSHGYI